MATSSEADVNPENWQLVPLLPPSSAGTSPAEPSYVPGYEPSAPPDPWWHSEHHHRKLDGRLSKPYAPSLPSPGLAQRPIDYLASALRRFWHTSHTVLRIDICRPIQVQGPAVQSRQLSKHGGRSRESSESWLNGIRGGGVQLKLMQVWDFPNKDTGQPSLPWHTNFGLGAKIEAERGGTLEPIMRVQSKYLSLHLLPYPFLELHGKWPLGGTRLAINIRYRIPLMELHRFWESPTSELSFNLYNPLRTGFHLTPGGLEFDEHAISMGKNTKLRIAAAVDFPRRFPLKEGEQSIRVTINRLGVKTHIT